MPETYTERVGALYGVPIEDKDIPRCPFCGAVPQLNPARELIKCPNMSCGIGSWWLTLAEWCTRTPIQAGSDNK